MPLIRSISGLRVTNDALSDELIQNYCNAFHSLLPEGPIVVGRDGRPTGEHIEEICANALINCGREVRIAGIVPTPTVQLLTEHSDAAGGIAITASHNPSEWNGLKFIGSDGVFIDSVLNNELWRKADNFEFRINDEIGFKLKINDAHDFHIAKILELSVLKNYVGTIRSLKLRAVVDAVNASGSHIVPKLLTKLGVEVVELYCDNSGIFPHVPEPLPQNLVTLAEAVVQNKADIGIAVDPDADRLVLIDEKGISIGEELTIVLAVNSVLSYQQNLSNNKSTVAVNLSTTRLVDDICELYDAELLRSPVGEINVVNKMREVNAIIGGEGSGGVILPECHFGRDSLVGIALTLVLLAQQRKTLSEICSLYPKYTIVKTKFEFSGSINQITEKIKNDYKENKINTDDGIRIDFKNSWIQLRKSNTEPIVRIIAEASTKQECEKLISDINKYI